MKLSDYMSLTQMTDEQFAKLVNRDRSRVHRWMNGKARPDWDALALIGDVTKGAVTANDFVRQETVG